MHYVTESMPFINHIQHVLGDDKDINCVSTWMPASFAGISFNILSVVSWTGE